MPRIDRLAGRCFAGPDRDHVGGVLLGEQTDVGRARELQRYGLLAVVAQAVADSGSEPLVGDADVLPDPEPRDARERARGRLEDETHGARLALRRQLVVVRVERDGLALTHTEAVLEERAPRDVVLEELG